MESWAIRGLSVRRRKDATARRRKTRDTTEAGDVYRPISKGNGIVSTVWTPIYAFWRRYHVLDARTVYGDRVQEKEKQTSHHASRLSATDPGLNHSPVF